LNALLSALDRHQSKKSQPTKDESVAVLFTKLLRDANAPEIDQDPEWKGMVKAHDDIVRAALMGGAGREIRHMGDGIMGAFPRVREAVAAAAEIQKFAAGYNARNERHKLQVRVGIHAGAPLGEVPLPSAGVVALAQRLTREAAAGEIFLSEAVRSQMTSKLAAVPIGQRQFRGYKEPVPVFSLNWRDDLILRAS
jgi:class 3 adenylate cyclase